MAHTRTNKNICLYCFGDLDSNRICIDCDRRADDTPLAPHHLAQRCVLIGKYLIIKSIGEGGFGITYSAWDLLRGIKAAIKEYFPNGYVSRMPRSNQVIVNSKSSQMASARSLKRFIDEAKTLTKVKNLNGIVSVKDFFSANGTAYIVMEYIDGISLKKYIKRKGGKLPMEDVVLLIRPIMESLIDIHELGLIHRDISPDNILITRTGQVKLIDFGAAKLNNSDGKSVSIVLKQGFAPEEQYRSKGEQGPYTDIYALSVTIYYAITGQLPPESIQRMFKDTIIKPSQLGAIISPSQELVLMKGLSVYAKNRYQDVASFLQALTKDITNKKIDINKTYDFTYSKTIDLFKNNEFGKKGPNEYVDLHGKVCRLDAYDDVKEQLLPPSDFRTITNTIRPDAALAIERWGDKDILKYKDSGSGVKDSRASNFASANNKGASGSQFGYNNKYMPHNAGTQSSKTYIKNPMLNRLLKKKR